MYKHFFEFRENPFNVNPDPRYLFFTPQTQEALNQLKYGIQSRKGLMLLTGEVGTGKTTLINQLLVWLRETQTPTAFISNSHLEISHLFDFMLADFGVSFDARSKDNAPIRLSQWLYERHRARKTAVVIIDEAQGLPANVLEQVRLLLNLETASEKLLQVVLAGQPELEDRLRQPELRQIKQRVALRCKTSALTLEETHDYIQARLRIAGAKDESSIFSPEAIDAVHLYSRGIPRVINLLCEHALINAYVDQTRVVSAPFVEEVAREFQFDAVKPLFPMRIFGERNSVIPMPTRGMDASVSAARVEMGRDLLNEFRAAPVVQDAVRLEVVKSDATPAGEPRTLPLEPESMPAPDREPEAATFFRSPVQPLAAPEHDLGPFVSAPDDELVADRFWNAWRNATGRSIRWIAARMKWRRAPSAAKPGQIPSREKPAWTGFAKGAARHLLSAHKSIHDSVLWLVHLSSDWKDFCLSEVNSRSWQQMLNRSYRWLKGPMRSARPFPRWFAWRDRSLSIVNSTEWEQMAGSLARWLREPFDPARWLAATPQLLDARRVFSQKKP
ncbi:MAG: AAA family ATPase [Candidatus Acidiferrales bacterium]